MLCFRLFNGRERRNLDAPVDVVNFRAVEGEGPCKQYPGIFVPGYYFSGLFFRIAFTSCSRKAHTGGSSHLS